MVSGELQRLSNLQGIFSLRRKKDVSHGVKAKLQSLRERCIFLIKKSEFSKKALSSGLLISGRDEWIAHCQWTGTGKTNVGEVLENEQKRFMWDLSF